MCPVRRLRDVVIVVFCFSQTMLNCNDIKTGSSRHVALQFVQWGGGQVLRGPRSLHQYLQTSCPCAIIFVGANSLTKKQTNNNVGQIFRPEAAHLRTEGIEIRSEGPISDHRGLITGLRAQPRPRGVGVAAGWTGGRPPPRLKILDGMSSINRDF